MPKVECFIKKILNSQFWRLTLWIRWTYLFVLLRVPPGKWHHIIRSIYRGDRRARLPLLITALTQENLLGKTCITPLGI